jgi:site-specific recombinase XerD
MIKLDVAHKQFIDDLRAHNKSSSTLIAYKKDIEQLMDHLSKDGIELVTQIELPHLESFMNKLAKENYTPKSISRKTNATKTFFRFLVENGHIKENVSELLKHPKVDIKAPRILSKLEYRALRDAAKDDLRSYGMIEVLLQTGVTISELADIKTLDLNITGETGNLSIPKRNNRETRIVPLNKAVVEAINAYTTKERPQVADSKHLFITKTGKPLLVRNIRSTINRYFRLAGVERAKVNDLRHTFVAHHLAAGVNILTVSKVAGHKRLSTTERYLQYIEKSTGEEKSDLGIL